ncbi:pentapeptide repeat-containing protein [Dolichospermum sp. ST_sed1]|nr:pentapeptide repeat-containing protein [Dolichospermum sp. ST_sed1]MDD1426792.1 pentapeptide repeat-containing protein [Dolichospermum sp. ST_sed9]MDD1433330.1 pentapeptide repeat-containing protein [Dolichospermum sp. ST_sed6]MDD1437007.1 pentapeptide repeat-containing protein [Dolichospermum sp. ST_sed10]MDD1442608.1 pentapeptide repeat-containing protein [Dolichospermum sp. ST_sed3]MDD1448347.1 pentapeptide repeat-containing protein [Dolichospermum sp. ST_sed8]MDD1456825.1 pentapeptide 
MVALNFNEQTLIGNNFRGRNLNGSTFFKARLESVRFDPNNIGIATQLRGTNFSESTWINVNARNAIFAPSGNFGPANFSLATLENVDLSGANLTEANLSLMG